MLNSKLQEMLMEEYQSGFSDGRKMMEKDIQQAAQDAKPIEINGKKYLVSNVSESEQIKRKQ